MLSSTYVSTLASFLGCILAMAPAGAANAFMITEQANGIDGFPALPSDYPAPETAILGMNRVTNSSACFGFGCGDPYDSFQFVVPLGLEIALTEFEITSAPAASFGSALVVLRNDGITVFDPPNDPRFANLTIFGIASIGINSNDLNLVHQSSVLLGPGLYDVVIINGGQSRSEVRFFATAAPEPSAVLLIAAALGALSIRRAGKR